VWPFPVRVHKPHAGGGEWVAIMREDLCILDTSLEQETRKRDTAVLSPARGRVPVLAGERDAKREAGGAA